MSTDFAKVLAYKSLPRPDKTASATALVNAPPGALLTSWDGGVVSRVVGSDEVVNLLPNWRLSGAAYPSSLESMPLLPS